METSQPLSIESFSYRWLVTLESLENSLRTSLDASDIEASNSYIEMDPRLPPSKRFFRNSQDFKFDFPISQSDQSFNTFVHADELISNGYLMPLFVDHPFKIEAYETSSSSNQNMPTCNSSRYSPQAGLQVCNNNSDCPSLTRWRRLSKRILEKYLNFLRPLYRRIIRGHKASSKADKIVQGVKNSIAYSGDDYRMSCDSDSSIYEAVLYCKRSIGVQDFSLDHEY